MWTLPGCRPTFGRVRAQEVNLWTKSGLTLRCMVNERPLFYTISTDVPLSSRPVLKQQPTQQGLQQGQTSSFHGGCIRCLGCLANAASGITAA